jgi:hypothetical protein
MSPDPSSIAGAVHDSALWETDADIHANARPDQADVCSGYCGHGQHGDVCAIAP